MSANDVIDGSHPKASRCQNSEPYDNPRCLLLATSRPRVTHFGMSALRRLADIAVPTLDSHSWWLRLTLVFLIPRTALDTPDCPSQGRSRRGTGASQVFRRRPCIRGAKAAPPSAVVGCVHARQDPKRSPTPLTAESAIGAGAGHAKTTPLRTSEGYLPFPGAHGSGKERWRRRGLWGP